MNSRHNWDSYSHQTLYDRIHGNGGVFIQDGAGVSGAGGAQDGWAGLASLMARARERTEAALTRAGAVWEGGAADAMRSGVTPLAQWADDAHTASTTSQDSTDTHVSAYASAKNHMPEPVPVTSTANSEFGGVPAAFTHLFGGQTDQDRQEVAAQEAKAEAVRIMTGYEDESSNAWSTLGQFVPPPSVVVDVSPPQPRSGGDFIPVGSSKPPRSGQPVDDSTRSAGDTRGPGDTSPPGGSPAPPPGHTPVPTGTNPSDVATTPPLTKNPSLVQSVAFDQTRSGPLVPTGGLGTFGGPGQRGAGPGAGGRGFGGGISEGGSGRGPGGAGPGAGGARGAMPGAGGSVGEPVGGRAGARGAGGMGMAPVGGQRSEGDEDKEHTAAEYLRDFHDSFWDDTPPVAPAVIGDEDDE